MEAKTSSCFHGTAILAASLSAIKQLGLMHQLRMLLSHEASNLLASTANK